MRLAVLIASFVLAAGCNSNHGKQVCQKAGEKLAACFQQQFGSDDELVRTAKANATSEAAIEACAADDRSVKAYEDCNTIDDCGEFIECTDRHAQ